MDRLSEGVFEEGIAQDLGGRVGYINRRIGDVDYSIACLDQSPGCGIEQAVGPWDLVGAGAVTRGILRGAARGLTNAEVRALYSKGVRAIDTSGPLTRATAERVHAARNALKVDARAMMADRDAAAALERTNPIQPFEYYVEKYTSEGFSGEALWQRIIQGGTTPNAGVNSSLGVP